MTAMVAPSSMGIQSYYDTKIQELSSIIKERKNNLRRLEAQRNELNSKVRQLREELQLLLEPASNCGEVIKAMGTKKVLVKVGQEGKYVVDIDKDIKIEDCKPNTRIALTSDSYVLHKILPSKVDPLVQLMKVEKTPDSTYEMIGGVDKQIKEIKEVIELPIKHPEIFESLGISQPKGVLLYGPPGTGKTLLARAVAHHTNCCFIRVSGGELVQKYIGEGSRMVRELFGCLEVREAAQAILLAELRRIGFEGRKQVVDTWAPQLPKTLDTQGVGDDKSDKSDAAPTPPSPLLGFERSGDVHSVDDEVLFPPEDVSTVLTSVKKLLQYDTRRRQATAIVLMGVIGAEFQREIEVYSSRAGEKKMSTSSRRLEKLSETPGGEVIMDYTTVRHTGKALMYLLLKPPSSQLTAHTSVRRAAIDLIGRGFTLWEPYMDVSAVLIALLEISADSKHRDLTFRKGLPLSPSADTHRSARHALSLIATARPAVFIATIAKEVARSVAAASSISFNQPSPAAIAVYSHVRHQPSQNAEAQSTSILNRAKHEILRIIDLMVEKTQQEVVDLLTDVVDIVVYCLDQRQLKEKGMTELFPGLCRFNMVSYSPQSRRLAVGARNGQLALYDLRSSRCQMVSAHSSQVTALSFSPDDRVLASYSFGDSKICFWQTGSSLFGMLGSSLKCVRSYTTVSPSPKMSPALLKLIRLVWINHKNVILLMADGTEYKYTV